MNELYDQHLPPGAKIDHYVIREILGVGGFGVTYKARDNTLQRWVAIKEFLPSDLAVRDGNSATIKARSDRVDDYRFALDKFLEEARTLARFDHPNIVRVTRFLEANGTAYLIMDYVEGLSLSQYLKQHPGPVPEAQLKAWFIPILRGLVKVHSVGFLHRDIKPGNIYLRDEGDPVLIDFGAARQAIGEHSRSVTGIVSAGYAPTEQYGTDAKKQGAWTDLYSIGATLYRCISGCDPVDSPTRQSALVEGDPDPMPTALAVGAGSYSEAFLQLVDALLVLPVRQRPQEAAAVLAALEQGAPVPVAEPRSTVVTERVSPRRTDDTPTTVIDRQPGPGVTPPQEAADKKGGIKGIVLALVLLLLAGGGYVAYQQLGTGKPAPVAQVAAVQPQPVSPGSSQPVAPAPTAAVEQPQVAALGRIAVRSEPAGAWVEVDGERRPGRTPLTLEDLAAGVHRVRVGLAGFQDSDRQVSVSANTTEQDMHYLDPLPSGSLTLEISPGNARVVLPDIGPAYQAGMELPPGNYRVRLFAEGYQDWEQTLEVSEGENRHRIQMKPHTGQLTLNINPPNARIVLPDVAATYSPGVALPVGEYRVRATASGYQDWSGSFTVTRGDNRFDIVMEPEEGEYLPIVKIAPIYPRRAQTRGIEGYCIVEYTVTTTGGIRNPEAVECAPNGVFEKASLKASLKFKYKPRVIDGQAIEVHGVQNKFTYELEK